MNERQRLEALVRLTATRQTALGQASTRAAEIYRSPRRFAREQARLLRRAPTVAALSSELPDAQTCRAVTDHGVPILLTRAADGRVRAFVNACRRRGSTFVPEGSVHVSHQLRCPCHAGVYDLEGRRVDASPRSGPAPALDRARPGLVELPVAEEAGLIWYRLTPGGALDPAVAFGPVVLGWLRLFDLDRQIAVERSRLPMAGNWKLFCEGVRESYHFGATHTGTIARTFVRDVMHVEHRSPHARITIPRRTLLDTPSEERDLGVHSETLGVLFPRTTFSQGREGTVMIRVLPHSADRSSIELTTLAPQHADPRPARWARHHNHMCHVIAQDIARIESVQMSLSSQLLDQVRFGRNEFMLGAFHEAVDAWVDTHGPPGQRAHRVPPTSNDIRRRP